MKKLFYFMSMLALVAFVGACNPNPEEGPEEKVEPSKISFVEAFQEFYMNKGETIQLTYTIAPKDVNVPYTLKWESDDEEIAIVDDEGNVEALALGEVTITVSIEEYPDVKPATSSIKVLNPIKSGDFLYADGSWGESTMDKDIIAVVYWIGNPTLFDPILEVDYPNCTHGLAISLKQGKVGQWQKDFMQRFLGAGMDDLNEWEKTAETAFCRGDAGMAEWAVAHSDYGDLVLPYVENEDLRAGRGFCGVGGYTYTAIFEEFMNSDPEAAKYPLEIYTNTMELVKDIEAPANTSGWYVPSMFEAGLMINTALTKPTDFDSDAKDEGGNPLIAHNNNNLSVLNGRLAHLAGIAEPLPTKGCIATASDLVFPIGSIIMDGNCHLAFGWLAVCSVTVKSQSEIDAMTSEEKTKYYEDLDEANARYKAWMEKNDIEWKEEYGNENMYTRSERFLTFYGYEYSEDLVGELSLSVAFGLWGALMTAPAYANVDVETGTSNIVSPMYIGEAPEFSGCKGYDNVHDYVRAVIAF